MRLDPVFGTLSALALALLFASAALHKWRNLRRFAEVLADYALLPTRLRLPTGLIPVLETLIAAGLLFSPARRFAAAAGSLLLLLYATAMALNLRRGRREIACGCGGPDEQRPIAGWMAWRNLLLALLLAAPLVPTSARALTPTDAITIGGGLVVAVMLYLSADRLGQAARQARLLQRLA